jgi:hypothetical protein
MAQRSLLIGIDSGTQSTKALVVDAQSGKVLGSASAAYDLIPNLPPGAKEQHPETWRDATAKAIKAALKAAKATAVEVKAIGEANPRRGPHRHQAGLAAAKLATSEEFVGVEAAFAQVWSLVEHR